jgi:hypothetical protein
MRDSRSCLCVLMAVTLMGLSAVGCENVNKLSSLTGPTPDLSPSFASIQRDIIASSDSSGRPSCVSCHTSQGRTPAGALDLSANVFGALVNAPSRQKSGAIMVVPGDPDSSYLIQKLEGTAGIVGLRMPRNGPPFLTDGQVQIIRRWILLGAKND